MMDRSEYFVERAAATGSARALYLCALLRLKRSGGNIHGVVQLLKRAISYGEPLAYYELGMLYESFESGLRCIFSAAEMYAKGHERGDARAAAKIGDLCMAFADAGCSFEEFCINDAVKADHACLGRNFVKGLVSDKTSDSSLYSRYRAVAKDWYKIGASAGNGYAHYRLGRCLEHEWSPGDDVRAVLGSYRSAAECGEERGALALGRIYEDGCLVVKDLYQAKEWYSIAAGMGSAEATFRLGVLLRWNSELLSKAEDMGYISPDNYPCHYRDLEGLAKKGDAKAQYDTACILVNGGVEYDEYSQWEIEPDEAAARLWFRRAAALGCIYAYGMLGLLAERQNRSSLVRPHENQWFVRGAERGLGYACWKLYKERCDCLSDYSRDVSALKANLSPINAWTLGHIYDNGLVSELNSKATAYQFYRKAGEVGFTPGIVSACKLVIRGYVSDPLLDVRGSLTKSAATGDVGAVYWLAYCMENGLWGSRDLHGAIRLYYLAANFGNVSAMVGYGRTAFCAFGQDEYFSHNVSFGPQAEKAAKYLIEIADALQLKNRYFADVKPSEYLSVAIEKGNEEALEVMARYWAAPHYKNRVGYGKDEKIPHDLYFEENLKKSILFFERAITAGRVNLTDELNLARQRLGRCVDGRYMEQVSGVVPSDEEILF